LNEKIIFQENLKVSWKSSDDVIKGQWENVIMEEERKKRKKLGKMLGLKV
jgi:hypothetical protein